MTPVLLESSHSANVQLTLAGLCTSPSFYFRGSALPNWISICPNHRDFCNHVRKGVFESHVGRLLERPGLSFQHLIFVPDPLLDELCSPAELLDQLPTHTGKLEVLLGSLDAVAREVEPCR